MDDRGLERVARALCVAYESEMLGHQFKPDDIQLAGPPDVIGRPVWMRYRKMARAAIEAMEPNGNA